MAENFFRTTGTAATAFKKNRQENQKNPFKPLENRLPRAKFLLSTFCGPGRSRTALAPTMKQIIAPPLGGETGGSMTVQEAAALTRVKITAILDQRLPNMVARAWPAYKEATQHAKNPLGAFQASKLHCLVRQAAIETGFNYEDAGEIAKRIILTRQRGDIALAPEALVAFVRPAFDEVIEDSWSGVKKGIMLAALERKLRSLERPLDEYAQIIQNLLRQMERIQEQHGVEKAALMKRVSEISKVHEKLVWRIASGGKRVILNHVNLVAKALNQIEASGD